MEGLLSNIHCHLSSRLDPLPKSKVHQDKYCQCGESKGGLDGPQLSDALGLLHLQHAPHVILLCWA